MTTVNANHWSALKARVLQADDSLQEVLTYDKTNSSSAFAESFAEYTNVWQEIGGDACSYELDGLCDVCMLFHASALATDLVGKGLDDKHGKLLKKWQKLFVAYLEEPDKDSTRNDLVRFLQEPLWAEPLADDDVEMLKNLLLLKLTVDEENLGEITPKLASNEQDVATNDDRWKDLKSRGLEANDLLQHMLIQYGDNAEIIDSFNPYAEIWQEIGNEACSYELDGLCDVCMLFHTSALDIDLLENGLGDKHKKLLEKWQKLFIAYLDKPKIDSKRRDLVRFLQEPLWADPLSDDDCEMLIDLLLPESEVEEVEEVKNSDMDMDLNLDLKSHSEQAPSSRIQVISPDLLGMMQGQFEPYAESIFVALESDYAKTLDAEKFEQAILPQLGELEILSKVSETVGLEGLQSVFEILHNNMHALCSNKLMLENGQSQLLTKAMSHILYYMADIEDVTKRTMLAEHFLDPEWPSPITEDETQILVELFKKVSLQSKKEALGARKIASHEDVSLSIPDDVNPELLESIYNELPILTEDFTEAVQQLLESGSIADVENAQRIAHTLKGSGNLIGLTGVASLTHNIEEIMEKVATHGSVPKGVFDTLLMDCSDCLGAMSDCVLGRGSAPDNAQALLQQLLDLAYQIKAEGIPESVVETLPIIETEVIPASSTVSSVVEGSTFPPIKTVDESQKKPSTDSTETMTRIPSSLVENMLRMAGENSILTGQLQQRLSETIEQNVSIQEHNTWLLELVMELEQLVEEQVSLSQDSSTALNEDFDPLEMDQYNELHTCANRLLEVATDAKDVTASVNAQLGELKDLLIVQERLQKENHELVLQSRMVPVQSIESRLQRTIRQAGRTTDKKVKLHIIGTDTLIDRDILNSLVDALMHLLRNAVDHGIESSEQRLAVGKNESGNITLEFSLRGDRIIVVCQDDGGGLDLVKIRAIAEEKNLITAHQPLSEKELQRLILKPGFSTRDSATQLSGRGIGMNAVHDQVLKLKGELDIDSQFGSGSRIELALPATLVSVRALLIRSGGQLVAVSNRGLEQILYPGAGKLKTWGEKLAYQQGEKLYAAEKFENIINIAEAANSATEGDLSAMLFRMESGEIKAILVDQVMDSRELVIKSMGQYVPKIYGIMGATILGDGSVTPVLDIPELLGASHTRSVVRRFGEVARTNTHPRASQHALVIDDSLSARRSLAQLLSDMGYEVSTAIDGIDAIEKMEISLPDVILVDLEMPRMNGIELTLHVRNRAETQNIPVIMVTSRATDKHRRQAESAGVDAYLTKPFSENEIMDQIARTAKGAI